MKTYRYKTLRGLVSQSYCPVTFNQLKKGQFIHKTHGWVKFKLPDEELEIAFTALAKVIWERNWRSGLCRMNCYNGRMHGIFDRLWIDKDMRAEYCAGQDYTSEIRFIQRLFR